MELSQEKEGQQAMWYQLQMITKEMTRLKVDMQGRKWLDDHLN